jgi:hypothetical protein
MGIEHSVTDQETRELSKDPEVEGRGSRSARESKREQELMIPGDTQF